MAIFCQHNNRLSGTMKIIFMIIRVSFNVTFSTELIIQRSVKDACFMPSVYTHLIFPNEYKCMEHVRTDYQTIYCTCEKKELMAVNYSRNSLVFV